jgi:hypothetical protein
VNAHGGQDWLGAGIVVASVLLAVVLDYLVARAQLAWETRRNARAIRSVRAVVARCPRCGCQVQAGHELDGEACRELQAERSARSLERAREWSA